MTINTPTTIDEVVGLVTGARADSEPLWFAGSGRVAAPPGANIVSTAGLTGIVHYEPDDLTVTVRSGTTLEELDNELSDRRLTAVLPETAPTRTVGGVVASGASGYRRLRYGPTRDRVIGVTLITGYGEVVRGGGRLVKNVTGYDLPRLVTSSHGALGFIAEVSLKLWPLPSHPTTTPVADIASVRLSTYQPIAALETESGDYLYSSDADAVPTGFEWPDPIDLPVMVTMNVPPRQVPEGIDRVRAAGAERFVAQHGVGVIVVGFSGQRAIELLDLRGWAESVGGSLVFDRGEAASDAPSRWGIEPQLAEVQARLKSLFDPDGVCNPGVLPGGL